MDSRKPVMTDREKPSATCWATTVLAVVLVVSVSRESLDRHEYPDAISKLITICWISFAAFCVWLTARVVKGRWAVALAALLAVASVPFAIYCVTGHWMLK